MQFIVEKSQCIAKDDMEIVRAARFNDFVAHRAEALQEQLADVGENGGIANGDAIFRGERKKFAEGAVDGLGGSEVVQGTEKFGGNFFGITELAFLDSVLGA
jgi:hypothetical protein